MFTPLYRRFLLGAVLGLAFEGGSIAKAAENNAAALLPHYEEQLKPFLQQHCVSCHGPEKEKGDVRLDTLSPAIADERTAEHWQNVLDAIVHEDMPPEDEPQPDAESITKVVEVLTEGLVLAQERLEDQGGAVVLRRLNQREYRNTIQDLLGVYEGGDLVEDGRADGFDTVGDAHFMSSVLIERYRELGRNALDTVFSQNLKGPPETKERIEEVEENRKSRSENFASLRRVGLKTAQDAIDSGDDDPGWRKSLNRCISQLASVDLYYSQPRTDEGGILGFSGRSFGSAADSAAISLGGAVPGTYRLTVRGGLTMRAEGSRKFLDIGQRDPTSEAGLYDYLTSIEVEGTIDDPQEVTYLIDHRYNGTLGIEVEVSDLGTDGELKNLPQGELSSHESQQKPYIWIDHLKLEGPLDMVWPPAGRALIYDEGGEENPTDERLYISGILERFTYEAFRHRPAGEDYLSGLEQLFLDFRSDGRSLHDAVLDTLAVVLASPSFAYLIEEERSSGATRQPLSDIELANRLSYFLWSRPPDTELYEVADAGQLTSPTVLRAQVERMLDHEWSSAMTENFTRQWLHLEDFDMIVVDEDRYPDFNEPLRQAFRREPVETFAHLVKHDGQVTDLIDADYVVINGMLGDFYDIPGVEGSEFRRVDLPADSVRGGLLGQGAILTMTGDGVRTSPVLRGTFVLEKLINNPPPPPPPNVPQLEQEAGMKLSIREQLKIHRESPQCASCHRKIDPPGLALENFDAIGAWREFEVDEVEIVEGKKSKKQKKLEAAMLEGSLGRSTIDTSGEMPDGQSFTDHETMKSLIDRRDMATGLAEAMLTYALGRRMGFTDQMMIEEMVSIWGTEHQGGLRSLVHMVVASPVFRSN